MMNIFEGALCLNVFFFSSVLVRATGGGAGDARHAAVVAFLAEVFFLFLPRRLPDFQVDSCDCRLLGFFLVFFWNNEPSLQAFLMIFFFSREQHGGASGGFLAVEHCSSVF